MKKIKRIFNVVLLFLLINSNSFASEKLLEENSGIVKYLGILVAIVIIALIIYLGYKSDKKSEEKQVRSKQHKEYANNNIDYYTEEKNEELIEDEFTPQVEDFPAESFEDNEFDEEETLFNSVNDYVSAKNEDFSMLEENEIIEDNENDKYELDYEEDFSMLEKNEVVEDNKNDKYELDYEEDFNIEQETSVYDQTTNNEVEKETEEEIEEVTEENIEEFLIPTEDFSNTELSEKQEEPKVSGQVKKYTGKKIGNKKTKENEKELDLDFEDDEDDEDIGVPTFDELLKKSEAEEDENVEEFDFMTQMEENLKKEKEKRLEKSKTTKKKTTKKTKK